jgi:hypothetical protein
MLVNAILKALFAKDIAKLDRRSVMPNFGGH